MKVSIDNLSKEITDMLDEYVEEVKDAVSDSVVAAGNACKKTVVSKSPERNGRYRKGWRIKKYKDGDRVQSVEIYNKTDWQLTHLLEKGHQMPNGTRFEGKPHISIAEREARQQLIAQLRKNIEGVGQ